MSIVMCDFFFSGHDRRMITALDLRGMSPLVGVPPLTEKDGMKCLLCHPTVN